MKLKKNLTKCALVLLLAGQITTPLNTYAGEQALYFGTFNK